MPAAECDTISSYSPVSDRSIIGTNWRGDPGGCDMPSTRNVNDPKHWHDRAAAMRALAGTMDDAETKDIMLKLAGDYDRLADRAAKRGDGGPAPKQGSDL